MDNGDCPFLDYPLTVMPYETAAYAWTTAKPRLTGVVRVSGWERGGTPVGGAGMEECTLRELICAGIRKDAKIRELMKELGE